MSPTRCVCCLFLFRHEDNLGAVVDVIFNNFILICVLIFSLFFNGMTFFRLARTEPTVVMECF